MSTMSSESQDNSKIPSTSQEALDGPLFYAYARRVGFLSIHGTRKLTMIIVDG